MVSCRFDLLSLQLYSRARRRSRCCAAGGRVAARADRPGADNADLYCAENLALLDALAGQWAGTFQLLYLDPPFGSGKAYAPRVDCARGRQSQAVDAYRDDAPSTTTWPGWSSRLAFCRDLLTESGTLYVHLDWHAVHYAKVALDRLFGREAAERDHLVLPRAVAHPQRVQAPARTLLVYTRSASYFLTRPTRGWRRSTMSPARRSATYQVLLSA